LDDKLTAKAIKSAVRVFQKQNPRAGEKRKIQVLAHAYDQAMERINAQKLGLKELALQVMTWIVSATRQLSAVELQQVLAVEIGTSELDKENLPQIEDMVSVYAGLVTVDRESNVIQLVHHTTEEYFERTPERWFPNAESDITRICATYLSFSVFNSGFCESIDQFEERLLSNPLYEYTA
jgi:hypothetical protein